MIERATPWVITGILFIVYVIAPIVAMGKVR